jgi:hypothetical protein
MTNGRITKLPIQGKSYAPLVDPCDNEPSPPLSNDDDDDDDDDDQRTDDEHTDDEPNCERRASLLDESTRRLLVLGTIRPSKTFYKDLSDGDIEHLMEYFHRIRVNNRTMTSDQINHELASRLTEYKPKICKCDATRTDVPSSHGPLFSFRLYTCDQHAGETCGTYHRDSRATIRH